MYKATPQELESGPGAFHLRAIQQQLWQCDDNLPEFLLPLFALPQSGSTSSFLACGL